MQKVPLEDEENALADTRSHVGTGRPFEIRGSGEKRADRVSSAAFSGPLHPCLGKWFRKQRDLVGRCCCPGLEKALFGVFHKQVGGLQGGSLVSGGVELFSSGVGFPFLSGGGGGGACLGVFYLYNRWGEETFECTGMKPL